uniref:WD_REPEATS_REGION domain-containing protein n=1 Tax=Caenorhabditis tropicalis TaxID=1561998 RepID=A0A1I7TQZ1_9PELO
MFGASSFGNKSMFGGTSMASSTIAPAATTNTQSEDFFVDGAPEDTIQVIKFSPVPQDKPMLACGAWDGTLRVWMFNDSNQFEGKAQQNIPAPILDLCWTEDASKIFIACADKEARLWDLASNQLATVGMHDGPVKTCHWINGNNYQCLMTGSFDKTLRFWDMKSLPQQSQMASITLPERVYAADVQYPMAVVALANKRIKVYNLENGPTEVKDIESQLKFQIRCISIFRDKTNQMPAGFALGSIEGRVAVQYVEASNPKDNFTFKCHRSAELVNSYQEIYAVNDICFHPQHGTLVTIGSDGRYSMWDKDARTKLKTSDPHPMPLTCCDVHSSGMFLVYAMGYDWSRGHEGNTQPGSKIVIHKCVEDMKPRATKK